MSDADHAAEESAAGDRISLSFRSMRTLAHRFLAPALAVVTMAVTAPLPAQSTAPPPAPHGLSVEEEAKILALEDRREYDPKLSAAWAAHPNSLHRIRIALALARIGPHTFVDVNDNGTHDSAETHAGMAELTKLASDPDGKVRQMAAFALGEIGDDAGGRTLFYLSSDKDPAVAAEAVEAISKVVVTDSKFRLSANARYLWSLDEKMPEAVRARAARYLFRFDSDETSKAALGLLSSTSGAVRQEAAYTLARRMYVPAREQLQLLLTDPSVLTRAYAATALGRIADAASTPMLVDALGDIHPWVRTNAAVAISRIAEKSRAGIAAKDLPRIFAAADDPDPGVRASMVDVLAHYAVSEKEALQRLTNVLKNGTQWDRELAAGAIAKQFAPDGKPFLELGELTPWQVVRVIEATAAAKHGPAIRAAYAAHTAPMVRTAALSAIPDEGVDAEMELVKKAFTDADVVVRATAYDRYGAATKEPAEIWMAALQKAERRERTEAMNDGRIAAIQAFAKLRWPGRSSFLRRFLDDKDVVVRRIASDALEVENRHKIARYAPFPAKLKDSQYAEIVRWARQPHTATIYMTRGKIEMALLAQDAPMTAWNFAQLAKKKFYDNSTFMRVVPNFVVQGGDPRNDMSGGPGYAIRDEINPQRYTRGAVGMALSGPDTGGSQFFITHSPQPHLDGGYTIFGRVTQGMSGVVDQIERGDRVERIVIDEKGAAGAGQIDSVPNVSLPLRTGPLTAEQLLESIPEYRERRDAYTPDITVLEMMKSQVRAGDRLEVFLGTWCDDSQREVPKLLRILDDLRSQFGVDLPVTFMAIDRSKQQPARAVEGKNITRLSTFIYYRGTGERGRIEERPEGLFEDALLTIATGPQQQQ